MAEAPTKKKMTPFCRDMSSQHGLRVVWLAGWHQSAVVSRTKQGEASSQHELRVVSLAAWHQPAVVSRTKQGVKGAVPQLMALGLGYEEHLHLAQGVFLLHTTSAIAMEDMCIQH